MKPGIVFLLLAGFFLGPGSVLAQTGSVPQAPQGAGYDLNWNTVDGGGYTFSSGEMYSLGGTVGQADAGAPAQGDYSLIGGFWTVAVGVAGYEIYLPLVLRSS